LEKKKTMGNVATDSGKLTGRSGRHRGYTIFPGKVKKRKGAVEKKEE